MGVDRSEAVMRLSEVHEQVFLCCDDRERRAMSVELLEDLEGGRGGAHQGRWHDRVIAEVWGER
eukprot:364787-Hanusia_phi.AAC.1